MASFGRGEFAKAAAELEGLVSKAKFSPQLGL